MSHEHHARTPTQVLEAEMSPLEVLRTRVERMSPVRRIELLQRIVPRMPGGYCPHVPHPPQALFLLLSHMHEVFYGGAAGPGKDLDLDTPLATPDGWTSMRDVAAGDVLFDERGQHCKVVAKSDMMMNRCVRVSFSDGTSIVCGDEHLWQSFSRGEAESHRRRLPEVKALRRARTPSRGRGPRDSTVRGAHPRPDLALRNADRAAEARDDSPLDAWDGATVRAARDLCAGHVIPLNEPLVLPDIEMSVDPWVFGLWLGDGTTARGDIAVGGADGWLLDELERRGYAWQETTGPVTYLVPRLHHELRALGFCAVRKRVQVPKEIPQQFLRAGFEQRLAIVQGIVDSDGHVDSDGMVTVTWTKRLLVDGLVELLATLGVKASVREGRATLYGKDCGPKWDVRFMTHLQAALLPRKRIAQKVDGFRGTHARRYVTNVEYVPTVPTACIQVDSPSGLFLAGRQMVPTHNSDALLMGALQYVDVPGYAALLLRRTYSDLAQPGALMDRAESWLIGTDARKLRGGKEWRFPSGARIVFGHLLHHKNVENYQSAEYQYIGFDELTQFEERTFLYMQSRCRKPSPKQLSKLAPAPDGTRLADVPLRIRAGSNPGNRGHQWVKNRYVAPLGGSLPADRAFIKARLRDNPSLNVDEYMETLAHLSIVDRERLLNGDWDVVEAGAMFRRWWFKTDRTLADFPRDLEYCRYWDLAATEVDPDKKNDPDWTVGALVGLNRAVGEWYVLDIVRVRETPHAVDELIKQTASLDRQRYGHGVRTAMEQEPGASGKREIDRMRRVVLAGYRFRGERPTGDKRERAKPYSVAVEGELVRVPADAPWLEAFFDEHEQFPTKGVHDDQVDAVSGAFGRLAEHRSRVRVLGE